MAWKISARAVLALMVFWGQIQNFMMRVNLSILIVAMVKDPVRNVSASALNSTEIQTCMENRQSVIDTSEVVVEEQVVKEDDGFEWDEFVRGQVLGINAIGQVSN